MDDSLLFRVEAYGQLEAFVRKDFNGYRRGENVGNLMLFLS